MISPKDASIAVRWSIVGLTFLSYVHVTLVIAWALAAIVNGFSQMQILHVPPIALEIFLVKLLADTLGFGFPVNNISLKHRAIVLTGVWAFVCISINVVHLVFSCIEIVECTSIFCLNAHWLLFVFLFVLGFLAVTEAVIIVFLIRFDRHLRLLKTQR